MEEYTYTPLCQEAHQLRGRKAFEDMIKEYGFNYSEMLRTNPNNDPKGLHVFYDNVIREAAMHKIRQRGLLREGEE